VDELTRSKERLETKARIHSELGQALLSTRRYLLDEDGNQPVPLELWQRNIAMLRKEAELKEDEQPLEMLSRIAASTGIAIQLNGELPLNEDVQKLFVQAAAEALTNAVSHAQAKTLYIKLVEEKHTYTVFFQNDGDRPDGEITEGGGLGSLRKKVEREGGTMIVKNNPEFSLVIALPKERSDNV
jgi:signal transduction histidine kinase